VTAPVVPPERSGIRRVVGALGGAASDSRILVVALAAALLGNALLLPLAGMATLLAIVVGALVLSLRRAEFGLVLLVVSSFVIPTRYGLVGFSLVMASGLLGLGLWFAGRVVSGPPRSRLFGTIDILAFVYFMATLLSYANAAVGARSAARVGSADLALVLTLAYLGVLLFAMEVVTVERQVYWLLNLLLLGCAFMAAVAVVEFATGLQLADRLRPPGFTIPPDTGEGALVAPERLGLTRVFGTANGSIEFSAVLSICLPLAIFDALKAPTRAMRRIGSTATALILVAVPLAVSRTGIVGLTIGLILTYVGLDAELRSKVLRRGALMVAIAAVVVPTSLSVFSQVLVNFAAEDETFGVEGRAGDYTIVRSLVLDKPVLGTGLSTFNPREARIVDGRRIRNLYLDNQYLSTMVNSGLLGLASMAALPIGGIAVARACKRRTENERLAVLAHCASVSLFVAAVTWGLYDALAFRTATVTFFIILAIVGSVDSVTRNEGRRRRVRVS
jgi:polysaccharide biosynthesis protein PslJ